MRSRAPPIEWRYHSGDAGSKRFSPATQIDSSNVSDLRMVWRWRAPDWDLYRGQYLEHEEGYENQSTPLMVPVTLPPETVPLSMRVHRPKVEARRTTHEAETVH